MVDGGHVASALDLDTHANPLPYSDKASSLQQRPSIAIWNTGMLDMVRLAMSAILQTKIQLACPPSVAPKRRVSCAVVVPHAHYKHHSLGGNIFVL